ncbi:hypothetical protein GS425_20020, partial [Rhodococcus hoagii]|nr:hypothetical protein [Prescottella equi]
MSADHLPAAPMLDDAVAGLPVTAAQSEILVAQQLDPQSTVYNLSLVVEATGPIDIERAAEAIRRTVEHAEALHVLVPARRGPDDPPGAGVERRLAVRGGRRPRRRRSGGRGAGLDGPGYRDGRRHHRRRRPVRARADPSRRRPHALVPALPHSIIDGFGIS